MLYARQKTRCEADAEDVLQNALLKTWKSHGDRPTDQILGLVYTNIRRCAIDLARQHRPANRTGAAGRTRGRRTDRLV